MTKAEREFPKGAMLQEAPGLRLGRGWRWGLYLALAAVLLLGYWAYQQPSMVVMWQDFLTLCGIG